MESTYSSIYESESDFDILLAEYDLRVFGDRVRGPDVLEVEQNLVALYKNNVVYTVNGHQIAEWVVRGRYPVALGFEE